MLIVILILVELVCSIKRASLGLAVYLGLRLCVPPYARFAGVSVNSLLLMVFLSCLLFHLKLFRGVPAIFFKHSLYVLILFSGLFCLTFFSGFVPLEYQHKELFQFFFTEILPFLLIPLVIREEQEFKTLLYVLAIASLFNVFYGLFTYIFNTNPVINMFGANISDFDTDLALSEEGRFGLKAKAVGIYNDKIFMALVSLLIFTFFYGKSIISRKLLIAVLVVSAITCFFTTQRTALFCLIIFGLIAFDKQKIKQYIKEHSTIFVLLCIIVVVSPPFKPVRDFAYSTLYIFNDDKQQQIGNGGSSVTVRWEQFVGVVEIVGHNMLHGLGYGFANYREGTSINFAELYGLESFVFKILVHSGLIGLLIWIFFFYKLYKSISPENDSGDRKYYIAFFVSYMVAILMTDCSGSFFLFLVFGELNCYKFLFDSIEKDDESVSVVLSD